MNCRFFVSVALALCVNMMMIAFLVQRRSSGVFPRLSLSLIETMNEGTVFEYL